jgi:ribosome biogenesis GTPase
MNSQAARSSDAQNEVERALYRLGWTDADTRAHDGGTVGRIGRVGIVHGRHAEVYFPHAEGGATLSTHELTTDLNLVPVAGDWVSEDAGRITEVLPRRTCLSRPDPNGRDVQVLAANIDVVAIVLAVDLGMNLKALERLAVMAWESGAVPVVVLTKCDVLEEAEIVAEQARGAVPGVDVLTTSAFEGTGLEPLRALLERGTSTMLGASGAGKTSLLNALERRSEPVRDVRRDGQGRHTTTTRRLYLLAGGGVLLDLPGIRALDLLAGGDGVDETFTDIVELALHCRFTDCAHDGDAGCVVEQAVADGRLPARRLDSWRSIQAELAYQKRRMDPAAMAEQRLKWKQVSRQVKSVKKR